MPGYSEPVWAEEHIRKSSGVPLESGETVDLAVVGAGILGLATAFHAARNGLKVQVIDAGRIGDGASGLNGGQVIPGLKYDPEWLLQHFGRERGEVLINFASQTADAVFDLIRKEKLDVAYNRNGWIQACHTEAALKTASSRFAQWKALGADVEMLDAQTIERLIGTSNYHGGFLDRRAGVIQPLAYTMELSRIAAAAGARITENMKCRKLEKRQDRWLLTMENGVEIGARSVLVATNAYTGNLVPGLAQTLVPLHSFQIATEPLPEHVARDILPQGHAVSDSRRILVYYRRTPDRRLILGGRGPLSRPKHIDDWSHLERAMARLFPSLSDVEISRRWYGRVAMTPDHLPHLHEPEKGLLAFVGCQGRGVGLMTAMSRRLADYILTGDQAALPFPITPIKPISFHFLRNIGVAATIGWYRMLDAIEQ
ncbi:FAD-binding oxidoreductase [Rhizobium sp. KVB221]|uniref:FAD-binding oxidoreductase n=1 Tax=Rhizobium setariae TaxID=2801340 RepID=A0A936YM16_9HYPH|nr:FAD-binding oxidoreductase [Rhizobium setariae]MBL0370624.1 FAD-binding oxidoreductase [Rhizobium setariae]